MLTIELMNENGVKEKHVQGFVNARKFRRVLEVSQKLDEEQGPEAKGLTELEQIDMMIDLVASLFDTDKVTYDTILDGLAAEELTEVLSDTMLSVMGDEEKKQQAKAELNKVTQ
ncbi:phage tail assembly chaperone G [Terribacillus saccharophilus]|uniref:Phage tail assembly chaperone protein, TAC n=1 Tax=Terribacillus saccharophilus TaxID=361277 RepID=A0ABX4GTB6_9BACI|nr:hypothetical protein [Terribacillus saccharophilus]PAD94365.1 hypothetical protein CHH50_18985 [Terribacillus saccharophilus]PAD98109.1 hypothetical protein CHH48_18865 [Terribacillus saccharophilus]